MPEQKQERFLPIGTVVTVKGGNHPMMIINYCIYPIGEVYENGKKIDAKGKMYEYGACPYPEGLLVSDKINGFNHDQIDKVLYMGYVTDKQKELSRILNGGLKIRNERISQEKN